jgi:hypothetical protein
MPQEKAIRNFRNSSVTPGDTDPIGAQWNANFTSHTMSAEVDGFQRVAVLKTVWGPFLSDRGVAEWLKRCILTFFVRYIQYR